MRRSRAPRFGVVLLLFLAACGDPSTGLRTAPARIALSLAYPGQHALDERVSQIHVIVSKADESVVKTLDVPVPPEATEVPIDIDVPMTSSQETFLIQVQLLNGDAPLYTGAQQVTAYSGRTTSGVTVTMSYVGPVVVTVGGTGVGTGTVVSTPAGINCQIANGSASGTCSFTFPAGTTVGLVPSWVALSGNVFSSWSGACTGSTIPCLVTGSAPSVSVIADFEFNACAQAVALDVGSTASGDITSNDCQFATGQFVDYYQFTIGSQQLLTASLTATVQPELLAFLTSGQYWYSIPPAGSAATSQVLALPAGSYYLGAENATANSFGSYRLTLAPLSALAGCQITRTTFGLSQLPATLGSDCPYTTVAGDSTVADPYSIYVPDGKTLRVTVSSTAFPPLVEFRDGSNDQLLGAAIASSAGTTGSTITLTTTNVGAVRVWIASASPNAPGGAYTITIAP
jgi:hypothetical protein